MSDIPTKKKKKNPVWICADDWLGIFPFLPPHQLGLEMAMVGDRFDQLVDGHFGTRKWTFGRLEICEKIGKDGTKEMQIVKCVNSSLEVLPIPDNDIPLPAKVIGFKWIEINYLDHNVMAFLRGIRRLFDFSEIYLRIETFIISPQMRILKFIFANIWPLIKGNIGGISFFSYEHKNFLLHPIILSDCPQVKTVFSDYIFPAFPADDSANAWNGQAVAKWLCTPRRDGIPKVFRCNFHWLDKVSSSQMEAIKREFVNSSSRVNFIIVISAPPFVSIVPFDLFNEVTGERLTLKFKNDYNLLLVRCPILRDEKQWAEWEKGAIEWEWHNGWNGLKISVDADAIGDGLFEDAIEAGPSGQQQKQG